VEIKGVGEETAAKCAGASKDKECPGGFFNLGTFGGAQSGTSKVEKILREIGAYDMDRRDFPPEYFSFCAGRGGGGGMPDSHPRGLTKRTAGERVNKSIHDKAPTTSPAGSTNRNHRRT
jgi:hypothetical protein